MPPASHHIASTLQSQPAYISTCTNGVVGALLVGTNNQVLHNVLVTHTEAVHLFPFSADRLLTATVVVDDPKDSGSVASTLTRDRTTGLAVWSNTRSNTSRITATALLSGDLVPYKLACSRGCTVISNAVLTGSLSARFKTEIDLVEVRIRPVLFDVSGITPVAQTGSAVVSLSGEVFVSSFVRGQARRRRVRALKIEREVTPANYLPL